jgi:dihydrofolate reductase
MDITMIMVMSLDGMIANECEYINEWASVEDQAHYNSILKNYDVAIMGRKSYYSQAFPCPAYVLTNNEHLLKLQDNSRVTYVTGSVLTIANDLAKKGFKKAALLGGPQTNYLFLKENLVNDLYITIEAKLFGVGQGLSIQKKLNCELVLDSIERLNKKGTLLLHYIVE